MNKHKDNDVGTFKTDACVPSNAGTDPFDSPLDGQLVINDTTFAAARDAVAIDGMSYSFLKPPYMDFEDHSKAKRKLKEAYTEREFLLIYGYSGCGKTTILTQFSEKYPEHVHLINDFAPLSPSGMLQRMGDCIHLPLRQRTSEIFVLQEHLKAHHGIMFLFDEVTLGSHSSIIKAEYLRKIYMECHVPICICGIPGLYNTLHDARSFDRYCSLITRLDEHEMHGMRRVDAASYLNMVAEAECLKFSYPAQQALINIALNSRVGGIHAFTTVIGRCTTYARVMYYKSPSRSFPDNAKCIRTAVPEGKAYPGAELILTPPATPEPVLIDEHLVQNTLGEYKSHFSVGMNEKN